MERKIRVLQLISDCRADKAPIEFVGALAFLGEENIARRVCEYLENNSPVAS